MPSSSGCIEASVTISWQSVWLMSRASSAPRRVGLMPTTAAPDEPGAQQQEHELGHVLEQHADVERSGPRAAARGARRARAPPRRPRATTSVDPRRASPSVSSSARLSTSSAKVVGRGCSTTRSTRAASCPCRARGSTRPTSARRRRRSSGAGRASPRTGCGPPCAPARRRGRGARRSRTRGAAGSSRGGCRTRSAVGPNARFVAVARRVEHHEVVELLHRDAADHGVGGHGAGERLDRRDPAQALLDRARDQRRDRRPCRRVGRGARTARACRPRSTCASSRCRRRAGSSRKISSSSRSSERPSTSAPTRSDTTSSPGFAFFAAMCSQRDT